jgi:hypothetical protein
MNLTDIADSRLRNQLIIGTKPTAKEVVSWMGAMQAQDFAMAKWAVGLRMDSGTEETINAALDKGEIIRTHLLRPTWHLVSADDIYWLLELTSPQILSLMKTRHKQLELTEEVLKKSNKVIMKALSQEKHVTREELVKELERVKITNDDNRASHLLVLEEMKGLICSGKIIGNKQTYALLPERVPIKKTLPKEEALAELATRYFTSHGPATLHDFIWWSGLWAKDARQALELAKPKLLSETIEEKTYWFATSYSGKAFDGPSVFLLPAFDEFIISYKDRSAPLAKENHKQAISSNGIFRPVLVVNGQVKGLWKRTTSKNKVLIELNLFSPLQKNIKEIVEEKAATFGHFLGKEALLTIGTQ